MRKIEEIKGMPKYGGAVPWLRRNRAKAASAVSGGLADKDEKMHDDVLEVGDGEGSSRIKGIKPEVYLHDVLVR
jgi:hypothetical protein